MRHFFSLSQLFSYVLRTTVGIDVPVFGTCRAFDSRGQTIGLKSLVIFFSGFFVSSGMSWWVRGLLGDRVGRLVVVA